MQKAKVTIQVRLKVKEEEKEVLDSIMRRWSSCMKFACKRLLEDKTGNELKGREIPLPGAGSMGDQMPPAGFLVTLKRRGINSPAPELCNFAQFG